MARETDPFFHRAEALGFQAGEAKNAFFRFALDYCIQTIRGNVTPEEADEAWIAFDKGRHLGQEQAWPGKPKSFKVQVSKLRQFAEVGKSIGSDGYMLLAKLPLLISDSTKYGGIYVIATDICRRMLAQRRALSEQDVKNIYP